MARGRIAVLRPGGRLLVLHDYGRDDVSRLRGDLPEYGLLSRRDGPFLRGGFKVRVVHCFWTFESIEEARDFPRVGVRRRSGGAGGGGDETAATDVQRGGVPPDVRSARHDRSARRGISPGLVFLAIALIGSVLFALYAVTVRDASQIPLLAAGSAVLGIVFIALAVYALRSIWRAGIDGPGGRRSRSGSVAGSRSSSGPAAWPARSSCSCWRQTTAA